jgi:hypothetical protein
MGLGLIDEDIAINILACRRNAVIARVAAALFPLNVAGRKPQSPAWQRADTNRPGVYGSNT